MDGVTVAESDSRAGADNSKKNTIAHTNRILHSDGGAQRKGSAPGEGVWGYVSYWPALLANLVCLLYGLREGYENRILTFTLFCNCLSSCWMARDDL